MRRDDWHIHFRAWPRRAGQTIFPAYLHDRVYEPYARSLWPGAAARRREPHAWQVYVEVPRPALADLVDEFAGEPTIYGRELVLEVTVDNERVAEATWTEKLYDQESNPERYEIQQRRWRIGRYYRPQA